MFDTKGFDEKTVEKIYRICDILERISLVDYTKERLSLYGGTSLNFLHFKDVPRLSMDIDFNFRDLNIDDWGKERDKIDIILKKIFSDLNYDKKDIKIQADYPLTRFTVNYKTKDKQLDSIKIEIGYMRRMPIFRNDQTLLFNHFKTDEEIEIKTPISEELFGNKFCTLFYRYKDVDVISSRDLFDVYSISKTNFNNTLFETAVVLDSLMRPEPKIFDRNPKSIFEDVSIDNRLINLIRDGKIPKDLKTRSKYFIDKYISISKEKYSEIINKFFDEHWLDYSLLKKSNILHLDICSHPGLLWNLKRMKK